MLRDTAHIQERRRIRRQARGAVAQGGPHRRAGAGLVLNCRNGDARVRLRYSGDLGRPNLPITRPPDSLPRVEYPILESTYGGRFHKIPAHPIGSAMW
jgi:hypothetical protein